MDTPTYNTRGDSSYEVRHGAGADILNQEDYRLLPRKPPLRKSRTRLSDYGNHVIPVLGECVVKVCVDGRPSHPHFVRFVVVTHGPSLLGVKSCERLGLVKLMNVPDEMADIHLMGTTGMEEVRDEGK